MEMKSSEICVHWPHADEYIGINTDSLVGHAQVTGTREFLRESDQIIDLTPDCKIRDDGDGGATFVLTYRKEKHPELREPIFQFLWGTSTIKIAPGQVAGIVRWESSEIDDDSGPADWTKVLEVVGKRFEYEAAGRLLKRQREFKKKLLRTSQVCAITGEKTINVLDAAHIVPSADGGPETLENGLLLRTDIHRLWDDGFFDIDANGEIHIVRELSCEYVERLKGCRISRVTLERTRAALKIRWDASHLLRS